MVEAFDVVLTGIILGCHHLTSVLFDFGSIYLYVSTYFSLWFEFPCDSTLVYIDVSALVREALVVD